MSPALTWSPSVHPQLADDAAGRMLHLLNVLVDDHRPLRDQGARQIWTVAAQPPTPPAEQQHNHQHRRSDGDGSTPAIHWAHGGPCFAGKRFLAVTPAAPSRDRIPIVVGAVAPAGRCSTLDKHLVLRAARPARGRRFMTRIWSTPGDRARTVRDRQPRCPFARECREWRG